MHRTRHQAREAMFARLDQGAKADKQNLLRGMVRSINTLVPQTVDANLYRFPLQETPEEKRNDNHVVRDALRVAAAGIAGTTAGAALVDTLPAIAQTVSPSTRNQAIVWEMPSNFPTSQRAYDQMVVDHSKDQKPSVKIPAEKTPVAGNQEGLSKLELITDATLESASISGTDIAMIQTFKDGTRHLIEGSLIDPNRPPIDRGTLPINPLKVARRGNIIVAIGGQLSSIDQGAVYISMDGGKTGITVTDADGQFLEVSIPDTESVFLVEGDRMAENQPAYLKMISLAKPLELKLLGAADPQSTSAALKLQSASDTYRILSLDYRNFGYWERIVQNGKTISNTLKAQEQGFIMFKPLQFYDTDGKIVDVVIGYQRRGVPPNPDWGINSIIYIKEGQQPFLIQPWQELFSGESGSSAANATAAVFNNKGEGYMAVYIMTVEDNGNWWLNPYIIKLGRDYKDFTKQQLIARPGVNGFAQKLKESIRDLHFVGDVLYAVTDKGVFRQTSGDSWAQVNIYKIASDPPTPTPTPTPTFTPTPTPTQQDKFPYKVHLPIIRNSAYGTPNSGGW